MKYTRTKKVDRLFFLATVLLVGVGLLIFISASLGVLTRSDLSFGTVALKQIGIGVIGGAILMIVATQIPYRFWKSSAFYIYLVSIITSLLVFIPHVGFEYGGATRWIGIGPLTFQPTEFLKLGTIIYFAAWLANAKGKAATWRRGFLALLIVTTITEGIFLLQHDTDIVIVATLVAMFIAGGGRWRDLLLFGLIGIVALAGLVIMRPYVMERIIVFLNPSTDSQGAGYQIQQALIAVGAGGIFGRGFGQSIQKFNFLPEPVGDSIFAVAGEEFGFVGSVTLVCLFVFFALRGFRIATRTADPFGRLLVVGIIVSITAQAFVNMGAMLGVIPLTGVPLTFVSQGGTALLFALLEVGIVLNVSKR